MSNDVILYGLLYTDGTYEKHQNLDVGNSNAVDIYLKCAVLCAKSVAWHGGKFRLITNNKEHIEDRIAELGLKRIEVIERGFVLDVPSGIRFRSAHYKLELLEAFGAGSYGNFLGLIDVDTVMLAPFPKLTVQPDSLYLYDISEQVFFEHGMDRVWRDLEQVAERSVSRPRWIGGEFILGCPRGFRRLAEATRQLWPRYLQVFGQLHHASDEMLISAAVAYNPDIALNEMGALGVIARWWTSRTGYPQRTFAEARRSSFLHLPSDKIFLSRWADRTFDPDSFTADYRKYARSKLSRRKLYSMVAQIGLGESKFVGRLD
ncbi:hypothetical protein [Microvirga sp. TS319]|uniref:hypothetical protein n=1 Tax=Microvirga sp. TS319 TaxID=3241165 RepID=UPI00351A5E76